MSKKQHFKGLSFNYYVNGVRLLDKYDTIENFLSTNFPKSNNPLSPVLDTKIESVKWNGYKISNSDSIQTVMDLIKLLRKDNIFISNKDIRISQFKPKQELVRKEIYSIEEVREKTKDVLFSKSKETSVSTC